MSYTTARIIKSTNELKPGEHFITVTHGMRGYFAVEMWLNDEEPDYPFAEPYQSDDESWSLESSANAAAIDWAEGDGLPLLIDIDAA